MSGAIAAASLMPGDVLLFHGTSTIAKLIRLFDGTDVNHAGLYVGGGTVNEALGNGLTSRPLVTSVENNRWVLARRLPDYAGSMQPVTDRAAWYLNQGQRYAYEQIVLLAFLSATRKVPVTPVLGVLIRRVLDSAAALISRYLSAGQEPMICSEFVYRSYVEADPAPDDALSLEIDLARRSVPSPGAALRALSEPTGIRALGQSRGVRVHPQSLLARWEGGTSQPDAAGAMPAIPAQPVTDAEIEELGGRYLSELRDLGRRGLLSEVPLQEVEPGLRSFALAVARGVQKKALPPGAAAAPLSEVEARGLFAAVAADFITPGDLLRSPSLELVGIL